MEDIIQTAIRLIDARITRFGINLAREMGRIGEYPMQKAIISAIDEFTKENLDAITGGNSTARINNETKNSEGDSPSIEGNVESSQSYQS